VERSEIKPGDHIYTYRAVFTYSHHGISSLFFFCLLVSEFCNVGVSYVIPVLKFVPFFLLLKIC
jgi:hypothetical protein